MDNLLSRSKGKIFPVNPNRDTVLEKETYPSVKDIFESIDLGVIATPTPTVPDLVEECGEAGIPGLIIITAGFREIGPEGKRREEKIEKIREDYGIRILGPNSLGIINPPEGLNVSFTDQMPESGNEVFLSQSGALASSILDWAISANFGFNAFVSVGNMLDVDFGDLIDYFGRDPDTKSILMYVEAIQDPGKFLSAARGFARAKPILAVKSGKYEGGAKAVASHTGSLAGSDEVYEAAFKRAGITRVDDIEDLFTSSEILAKHSLPEGPRLAIVTNAGGPGAMASDAIIERGGELATLSEETRNELREALPERASIENPVDVTGDAASDEYRTALDCCLKDKKVDGVLCIYAPVGPLSPEDPAKAIAEFKDKTDKPILASWMGGEKVQKGRELLREKGFSVQFAPEQSVKVYMYLYRYGRNLERLLEIPEEFSGERIPPKHHIKAMLERTAREDRTILSEAESKKVLDTYNISSPPIQTASSSDEASMHACNIGFPVALKVFSHDITHKSGVGGVKLNLCSEADVKEAYEEIMENVNEKRPNAEIEGVTVQKMMEDPEVELIMGSKRDPVFGSVLMFGKGGTDVEYYEDTSIGFPPLNQNLAQLLIEDTKIYEKLEEPDSSSEVLKSLQKHLNNLSKLIIDFPEIKELDVNPLSLIDGDFLALDARIVIDKELALGEPEENEHLVIEPYPRKYREEWQMKDERRVTIRPIRPEDEPSIFELWNSFSEDKWQYRFFGSVKEITHEDMVRYTNVDYRRNMTIVGEIEEEDEKRIIGVSGLEVYPEDNSCQFAVVVGDPWKGLGLGKKLLDSIIGVAKDKGLERIWTIPPKESDRMRSLCKELGFDIEEREENFITTLTL